MDLFSFFVVGRPRSANRVYVCYFLSFFFFLNPDPSPLTPSIHK